MHEAEGLDLNPARPRRRAAAPALLVYAVAGCLAGGAIFAHGAPTTDVSSPSAQFQALAGRLEALPDDVGLGNRLRQLCREAKIYNECIEFFERVVEKHPRDANLRYNAALAYVDNVPGHSILEQARLSTHSIDHVSAVLKERPDDWVALYIRGVNNIYWPSWYRRNSRAIADLEQCVRLSETAAASRKPYHALAYLALGDALIKADREAEARLIWRRGLELEGAAEQLQARLEKGSEELRDFIDAVRSRDVPVDTDISFLQSEHEVRAP